ncbi:MAG: glutamine-hydrolyzing carbamoyl-phosphate synthase small subunit [bacterium]|nr:glutamine-hydrolyzing carbamoyl-phosphate synthase small subunit [bacterium]
MHPEENGSEKAELRLSNGIIFTGTSFGCKTSVAGEVVFNTGMVGYTEALTDPSYTGQILVLTYPLAGNYGVPNDDCSCSFESAAVQAAGVVVSWHCNTPSHNKSIQTLGKWLENQGIPAVCGVDTREITKHLREFGSASGSICTAGIPALPSRETPAEQYMKKPSKLETFRSGKKNSPVVALIDCGEKAGITRCLLKRGVDVVKVPHNHPLDSIDYSGILLSNGPGNPEEWVQVINNAKTAISRAKPVPVLGICLGHQILALAAGASTVKMKFGHRSQNQPCIEQETKTPRFLLTSQNHGYQVEQNSLPAGWDVWFSNVNDSSVEAIRHSSLPFTGVQFHPEASPGPEDANWIFDDFISTVRQSAAMRKDF